MELTRGEGGPRTRIVAPEPLSATGLTMERVLVDLDLQTRTLLTPSRPPRGYPCTQP